MIQSPLFNALDANRSEPVKVLLKSGADANEEGPREGLHALAYFLWNAANSQSKLPTPQIIQMVDVLLEHRANINHVPQSNSHTPPPLVYACFSNDPALVKYFLKKGAIPDLKDRQENTALHYCAKNGDSLEVLECLVENHVPVNAKNDLDRTALMESVSGELKPLFVKFFIENGAEVNVQDREGMTALHHLVDTCIRVGNLDEAAAIQALTELRKAGANFDIEDHNGFTPRDEAKKIPNDAIRKLIDETPSKHAPSVRRCLFTCFGASWTGVSSSLGLNVRGSLFRPW